MTEDTLKRILISIVLFSIIITGFMFWFNSSSTAYGVVIETDLIDSSQKNINDTLGKSMQMSDKISKSVLSEDASFSPTKAIFTVLKLAFTSLGTVISIFQTTAKIFHIPQWLLGSVIIIVIITFVWGVVEYYKNK